MIGESIFFEIAAILCLATLLAIVGQKLRQPLIIMFLATGILAGPSVLGIVQSYDQIELLAQIGIALLLFIVGLKLDLQLIRTTGPVALATGFGQIVFTSAIGLLIAVGLGMTLISAAYIAVALTFSSTIIIVKLLSDKKEIDSLHGQIAIGFLIVQDIAAILALVGLTSLGSTLAAQDSVLLTFLSIAAKGLGLLIVVGLLMKFALTPLTQRLAGVPELLVLFAISWAILLATASELLGFGKEVGAFLAGISLASTGYRDAIGARLTSLRDFLLLFFFIDLGARLEWSTVGTQLQASALFSVFVLLGNPLIVLIIMGAMGYRRRTSFLAGLTVAQISEFSLIVAALGYSLGHITAETRGLITLVGVVTIFASTYMILYSGPIYNLLSGALKLFERRHPFREEEQCCLEEGVTVDVIQVGLGNYGSSLAEHILRRNKTLIGVDFDPAALTRWRARGISVLYGDIADPEIHERLPLHQARWVVSTVRSLELNLGLIGLLRTWGYKDKIAVTASSEEDAVRLEEAGSHVVFRPFIDAAEQAADALTHAIDVLPETVDWPIAFHEVRVLSGSVFAGRRLRNISLRSDTGVSILAVSRAGGVHYDPRPDFRIYPGDRLILMGPPDELRTAETLLNQIQSDEAEDHPKPFKIDEISVDSMPSCIGTTLAESSFRQRHGVTVIGIRRGEEKITSPTPTEIIQPDDHLIVIGSSNAIEALKRKLT
ncbi:MAG: cation:proton antiporter [Syntrophales bacterium]|nr:cation:proton antiporter [Syntrophales bacterium]